MEIRYHSTRGAVKDVSFRDAILSGLADDGGLFVPETLPHFSLSAIAGLKGKSYGAVAEAVLSPFFAPLVPGETLRRLIEISYRPFDADEITPLRQLDERHYLLELFHGPTLAFKDIALQFLGNVFEYFMAGTSTAMTVVGATSGDTGSAAMAALAGRRNIEAFILYPKNGPSDIQRRQMTCFREPNVHAVGIEGSFDDCQAIVKGLFADTSFRKRKNLAAVNSINWLRILAQMVYYFFAAANLGNGRPVSFVVPTGNFGNVYAGYAAMKCGLPVSKLAVASNRNDILPRFFASGEMRAEPVERTLSPSMDIQVSSNFERLLFDLCGGNGEECRRYMATFAEKRSFRVMPVQLGVARQVFTGSRVDDEDTLEAIRETFRLAHIVLDPHSAVGAAAAAHLARELPDPVVLLACAHAGKFPETVEKALGFCPPEPPRIATLRGREERTETLPADLNSVRTLIDRISLF